MIIIIIINDCSYRGSLYLMKVMTMLELKIPIMVEYLLFKEETENEQYEYLTNLHC